MNTTAKRITAALTLTGATLVGTAIATPALARHEPRAMEYARVTHVEPIVETRSYSEPREQCWNEPVAVPSGPRSYTAPIVGAIIGGALGNAVGHNSSNQKVGAVVGAALGASVGNDIGQRNRQYGYRDEQVCRMVEEQAWRDEVVAYRVSYRYHGRDYVTEMPYDPGPRLPVSVDVEPAW